MWKFYGLLFNSLWACASKLLTFITSNLYSTMELTRNTMSWGIRSHRFQKKAGCIIASKTQAKCTEKSPQCVPLLLLLQKKTNSFYLNKIAFFFLTLTSIAGSSGWNTLEFRTIHDFGSAPSKILMLFKTTFNSNTVI